MTRKRKQEDMKKDINAITCSRCTLEERVYDFYKAVIWRCEFDPLAFDDK